MKLLAAAILLASATTLPAQTAAPDATGKTLLQNSRVTVSLLEIPAGTSTPPKKHGDLLTVFVSNRREGDKQRSPAVVFTPAGRPSPTDGATKTPVRAVTVEFVSPQGKVEPKFGAPTRYCNPGSKTACVEEKYLLCTAKVCVEEVTMGAGAVTTKHSHGTDHMIIAQSDYRLADDVSGKGVVMRDVKSGGVEYTPAGIEHTLTNKSGTDIQFVVVVFR